MKLVLRGLDIITQLHDEHELELAVHVEASTPGNYLCTARWPQALGPGIGDHLALLGITAAERPAPAIGQHFKTEFVLPVAGPAESDDQLRRIFGPTVPELDDTMWVYLSDEKSRRAPIHVVLLTDTDASNHLTANLSRQDPRDFDPQEAGTQAFMQALRDSGLCADVGYSRPSQYVQLALMPEAAGDRVSTYTAIIALYGQKAT